MLQGQGHKNVNYINKSVSIDKRPKLNKPTALREALQLMRL